MKTLLHIGSGSEHILGTFGFSPDDWHETRLYIDPGSAPDIISSMTNMQNVEDASVDAIFSSHNLEHLAWHEVPLAMAEFMRVLKNDGYLLITCPDLQSVCDLVAKDMLTDIAYTSPAGPIAPMDIIYGHRPSLAMGHTHMAHRTGFTEKVLRKCLMDAGFVSIATMRHQKRLALFSVATRQIVSGEMLRSIFTRHWLSTGA